MNWFSNRIYRLLGGSAHRFALDSIPPLEFCELRV
jgi:hypothetical protein